MNFVMLHDNDGLRVLLNLEQVESILELQDGFCAIVFARKENKILSFYPMETFEQVLRKLDFAVVVPSSTVCLSEGRDLAKKVKSCIDLPQDRIAGYCPNCGGTVDIKLTPLIKMKGHRCSWCGQRIDLTGVDKEYDFD